MRQGRTIGLISAVAAVGSVLLSACWLAPNANPGRSGLGDSTHMTSQEVPGLHQLWTRSFGEPVSTPITDINGLYAAVGAPSHQVVSLDAGTGATRWSNPLVGSSPMGMSQLDYDPGQVALVAVQPSSDGSVSVQRMDSSSGAQMPLETHSALGGTSSEISTDGGTETLLFYGDDGIEIRFGRVGTDPDGNVLSHEALVPGGLAGPSERTPAVRGLVTQFGQVVYVIVHRHLYAFHIDTRFVTCTLATPCGPMWTSIDLQATSPNPTFSAPVLVNQDSLVFTNQTDNVVMSFGLNGQLQWSAPLSTDATGLSQPATDGVDIDVAAPGKVEIFRADNFTGPCRPVCPPVASVPTSDSSLPSHVILAADVIFVSHGSVVDALPHRCGNGPCVPLWTHAMDSTVSGISISDGHLYVSTQTGITAFGTT